MTAKLKTAAVVTACLKTRRPSAALIVAIAALFVALGGTGYALSGSTPSTIQACENSTNGALRIVSSPTECRTPETPLSWNSQGPAGETGPPGPPGPAATVDVVSFNGRIDDLVRAVDGLAFVGQTHDVTLTDGQRVTATLSATLAMPAGISGFVNVCYQPSGGAVTQFDLGSVNILVSEGQPPQPFTVNATRTFAAGTYTIGYCRRFSGITFANELTGDLQGWALIT